MVHPSLWGPATWQLLFACAWSCPADRVDALRRVAMELVPTLLPCDRCREHARRNLARATPRDPRTARDVFRWLHSLKREIARVERTTSLTLDEVTRRWMFTGAYVDDVAVADCLVLFAIAAEDLDGGRDQFCEMCGLLAELLPGPDDSQLRRHLSRIRREAIVIDTTCAARAARIERGLCPRSSTAHYRGVA